MSLLLLKLISKPAISDLPIPQIQPINLQLQLRNSVIFVHQLVILTLGCILRHGCLSLPSLDLLLKVSVFVFDSFQLIVLLCQ